MNQRLEEAKRIAKKAGLLVLKYYKSRDFDVKNKSERKGDYLTKVDLLSQELIIKEISKKFGSDGIIAEEEFNTAKDQEFIWVIDPIDGTRGFVNHTGDFAVHIGVLKNNVPVIGVVYSPTTKELFYAMKGKGAYCNGSRIKVSKRVKDLRAVCSLSIFFKNSIQEMYRKVKFQSLTITGGTGLKMCKIARGEFDFLIYGKRTFNEWDLCAPMVILLEAGGKVTHDDLSIPKFNKKRYNFSKIVVGSNGKCHDFVLSSIKG
jgi:3'(2'), 5'-bisphosphate nucleotidase